MPETAAAARTVGWKGAARIVFRLALLSIPFFAAGTVLWTRGWIWIGLAAFSVAVVFGVARVRNPGLVRIRLNSKPPSMPFDKVFALLYMLSALAFLVVCGLDARWGWSQLSLSWLYAGLALHLAALVLLTAVAASNPFLESTVRIQSERGQVAVSSGPYAIVRHPMYLALIVMYPAWALVLGSLWACIPAACVVVLFVFRTIHEDRTLRLELPGYEDYACRTRYRLVPGLW
jgi:protein-S-isoprenylcysteine O-methyltransferase Ste14